jgi:hypothetical protein
MWTWAAFLMLIEGGTTLIALAEVYRANDVLLLTPSIEQLLRRCVSFWHEAAEPGCC